jgi:hypothetical protein
VTDAPKPSAQLSPTEVTALITLIDTRLGRMEDRIIARLDQNSAGATERWVKHDAELAENTKRVVARFMVVEADLLTVSKSIDVHLAREHDAAIALNARVKPVKSTLRWVVVNWRSVLVLLFGLLGFFAILSDLAVRYLGGAS